MSRPRYSHCPEGQQFVPGRHGKRVPIHTPKLGDACRCGSCRMARIWTPERRAAASERMRARPKMRRKSPSIACRWLPEQEQTLAALLGTMDTAGIAEELTRRFGWPRTEIAVRQRIKVLGLSRLTVRPWSKRELWRLLGLSEDTLDRYIDRGMLTGTPWTLGGGKQKGNRSLTFTRSDVERFIRAHPSCVEPTRIRDAALSALARSLTRGRPALTVREAAQASGLPYSKLMYWCRIGRIPSAHQIDGRFWRVSYEDVTHLLSPAPPSPDGREVRS